MTSLSWGERLRSLGGRARLPTDFFILVFLLPVELETEEEEELDVTLTTVLTDSSSFSVVSVLMMLNRFSNGDIFEPGFSPAIGFTASTERGFLGGFFLGLFDLLCPWASFLKRLFLSVC